MSIFFSLLFSKEDSIFISQRELTWFDYKATAKKRWRRNFFTQFNSNFNFIKSCISQIDISIYCFIFDWICLIGCVDDISIRACGEMFEVSQIKSSKNPATLLKSGKKTKYFHPTTLSFISLKGFFMTNNTNLLFPENYYWCMGLVCWKLTKIYFIFNL